MNTLQAIWGALVVPLANRGERAARRVLLVGLAVLGLLPFFLLWLKYFYPGGGEAGVAIATLTWVLGGLIYVVLRWTWQSLGLAGAGVIGPAKEQAKEALRGIRLVVAFELLAGTYIALVPVEKDIPLVPILALILVTLAFIRPWTKKGWGKPISAILTLAVIAITLIFIGGGREAVGQKIEEERARQAAERQTVELVSTGGENPLRAEVVLRGPRRCSEPMVVVEEVVPDHWDYFFVGPPQARATFPDDGASRTLERWNRTDQIRGGAICFTGPAGETVQIVAYPPR